MKRVVALSVAMAYMSMATTFAQEPAGRRVSAFRPVTFATTTPTAGIAPAPAISLSKLTATAAPAVPVWTPAPRLRLSAMSAAAPTPRASKSFWKSPWPYLIGGAVVVAVVVARRGYKSNTPGCNNPGCAGY